MKLLDKAGWVLRGGPKNPSNHDIAGGIFSISEDSELSGNFKHFVESLIYLYIDLNVCSSPENGWRLFSPSSF